MDYVLVDATERDRNFFYQLHKLTMKDIVEQVWGWDEDFQSRFFKEHFTLRHNKVIIVGSKHIGRVQFQVTTSKISLTTIQITPEYQGKGLGTKIVEDFIKRANMDNKHLELQVIKVNERAKKLYERLGFSVFAETETHYVMKKGK